MAAYVTRRNEIWFPYIGLDSTQYNFVDDFSELEDSFYTLR